jgi:CheY-like chemotaxis protein
VVLCDDHAVLRRGIRDTLAESPEICVTGEAGSYAELREVLRAATCDVLLLDLNLPGRSGLEALASLKESHPTIKVLIVSMYPEDQYALRCLKAGAHGYANGQPIVPGMHVPIPRVAVAVDTSGSMGSDELKEAMTEVKGILLAAGARVEFIACDAEVHAKGTITTFQQATKMLKGGGGTDFRPVFDELEKRRGNRPELLVFLTDGYGPAPEKQPSFRTIWFLVGPNTQSPSKWGECISFGKAEAEEAA